MAGVPTVDARSGARARAWVGSEVKAMLAEMCASLVEEVAPLIAAAARGQLDIPAAITTLRRVHSDFGVYLDAVSQELARQDGEG